MLKSKVDRIMSDPPEYIKNLPIADTQKELLTLFDYCEDVTSSNLAKLTRITSMSISMRLKRLKEMGLLTREFRAAKTGGLEYVYKMKDILKTKGN
jgi:predicted transcriptional regulator